jgi:hypothetical protein
MMLVVFLVCGGIALGILACLSFRSRPAGWVLLVLVAVWEPLNNKHMEGAVLLGLGGTHGVTSADLYGLTGFLVATATLVYPLWVPVGRPRRSGAVARRLLACVLIFCCGLAVAMLT